jgi:hypothetical protein
MVDMNMKLVLQWLYIEHLAHKEMVGKDLMEVIVE